MREPEFPKSESIRLQALQQISILDSEPEERFDRITRLLATVLEAPIALVSLVDADRQWFKSRYGLEVSETSRCISFCGHAILTPALLVVEDTLLDERFVDNPLVAGPPYIRSYAGAPLADAAGNLLGTLCVIDRKPRVFTERDFAILRDLAAVAARELVLDSASRDRSKRNSIRDELRVLHNRVAGTIHRLSRTQLSEEQVQHVDTIALTAGVLSSVVDDLAESGRLYAALPEEEPFSVREVLEETVCSLAGSVQGKTLELLHRADRKVPALILGDAPRLRRVLLILLDSAQRFTASGEVSVTCRVQTPQTKDAAGILEFDVRDTGAAIPNTVAQRMFSLEPGHMLGAAALGVPKSPRARDEGTGACVSLIKTMGGTITLVAATASGAHIRFTLPLRAVPTPEDRITLPPWAHKPRRILVVDDNAASCLILKGMLEQWLCMTETTTEPETVMERLQTGPRYDALLLDEEMPGLGGVKLAEAIQTEAKFAGTPLILLAKERKQAAVAQVRFRARVPKPIREEALFDALLAALVP